MADPRQAVERFVAALNARDLEAAVAVFDAAYEDETPAHPGQEFKGQERVRENLSQLLAGTPDLRAEILRSAAEGDTAWVEWRLWGTGLDRRGINVFGVRDDRIVWGRIYTETVGAEPSPS